MEWNHASENWYTSSAENDLSLRAGGKFNYKMAARDGSYSFDISGIRVSRIRFSIDFFSLLIAGILQKCYDSN